MPKKLPADVLEALESVIDPETGESILKSGMLKTIKVKGKTVSAKFVPPNICCAGCGAIGMMIEQIKDNLKAAGYKAEIDV